MKPRDANDVHREEGVDALREKLDRNRSAFGKGKAKAGPKPKGKTKPKPGAKTGGGSQAKLVINPANPMQSARILVRRLFSANGIRTLHRHRGGFYRYNGLCFAEAKEEAIETEIRQFLETARHPAGGPFKPKKIHVAEIEAALRTVCFLDDVIDPPAWLVNLQPQAPGELLPVANGLLHLTTGDLLPPTPNFFALNASEVAFDCNAPRPEHWLKFLADVFEDDFQARDTLQDIFGYLLSVDTKQHKIFMLLGAIRSGKGTSSRILTKLIGKPNVVSPTLSSLSMNFGLEPIIAKPLAIIGDARLSSRTDQAAVAERLLSISGGDMQTIDRKFRQAWSGYLPTRFLMLSNELPAIADSAGALTSRFIVVRFRQSFLGREDHDLEPRLITELPSIMNWAMVGYRRLMNRGRFIQPDSSKESLEDMQAVGSPVSAFVKEKCEVAPAFVVPVDRLYQAWGEWCKANDRHTGTKAVFGAALKAAYPSIHKERPRKGVNLRYHNYEGIKLLP